MGGFRPASGGVTVKLAPGEAAMLRDLVGQIAGLIAASGPPDASPGPAGRDVPGPEELEAMVGLGGAAEAPADPVLARLLPDGYRDDPEAAQDFRRFTESGLRTAKAEAARALLDSLPAGGGKIRLTSDQADSWLRALNDVRLAFGVVLGVTDDFGYDPQAAGADEQRRFAIGVYDWLTFLQDSLVSALS